MLAFAVLMSLIAGTALSTPVVAGLTLALFVYTLGSISGAHLNPAVTVGLASVRKIGLQDAVMYIIFQIVGGLLAMLAAQAITGGVTGLEGVDSWKVAIVEAIGAFILTFGVAAVVYEKVDDDASGLVIGGSLLLGILVTGGMSYGVLNPAVAVGIGAVSATYLLAPLVGAVLAAWAFRYLAD